ncbi:MAG: hypothetical protein ABI612_17465 [Betaproteobacteria bacterium]
MSDVLFDQAAGLRKLLARNASRTIAIASAQTRSGRSLITANLAVALARLGQPVLLLDCGAGCDSSAWLLSTEPAADLLDACTGRYGGGLAAEGCAGVHVVQAQAAFQALPKMSPVQARRLADLLCELIATPAVVLIDAAMGDLVSAAAADELIFLVSPGDRAMTESYRFLKRLHVQCGPRRVHVVVNRAQSSAHADRIFGNLSSASRRFLNLPLERMGHIPDDDRLVRAARMRQPVVEVFPQSDAALALRDCADILMGLADSGADGVGEFADRLMQTARLVGTGQ